MTQFLDLWLTMVPMQRKLQPAFPSHMQSEEESKYILHKWEHCHLSGTFLMSGCMLLKYKRRINLYNRTFLKLHCSRSTMGNVIKDKVTHKIQHRLSGVLPGLTFRLALFKVMSATFCVLI